MIDTIHLHRDDLVKMIEFIDRVNPVDTTRIMAGRVTVKCDNSSGIGSIITATAPHEYADGEFGELTINIVDESSW